MQHQYNRVVSNRVKLAIQLGLIGLTAAMHAPLAYAGDVNSKTKLNIPSQDLGNALTALATQADLQILFSQDLVAGKSAAALSGEFSGGEALQRLLANADLDFTVNGQDTIVIRARNTPAFRRTAQQVGQTAPVVASDTTPASEGVLEEIVVTAQKRTERLQDVPVAVTAISGDMLEETGINDTASLTKLTPSLTFTQGAHPTNSSFRVRGIGTAVFSLGIEPSVSVVLDGVVLSRAAQGFADLADIERVEVLRGPQGMLFGKNAIGGVINVVTRRPANTFEANADATWAQGDEYRMRGSISGPLTDTVRVRLTGFYNDIGGNIRNVTLNKDVNGQKSMGFRGKLEWDATDNLNFLLASDYGEVDANCCSSTYISVTNPLLQQLLLPTQASFNNRQEVENREAFLRSHQANFSLEGNLELAAGTLTSISAYQKYAYQNGQPIDRLNTPVPLTLPVTNGQFDINDGTVGLDQFTQELRFTSPSGGVFNYVAGLYYLDGSVDRGFWRRVGNCATGGGSTIPGQPCVTSLYRSGADFHSNQKNRQIAAFGQADWKLVGGLSALGGVRVQREDISYSGVRPDTRLVAGDLPLVGVTVSAGSGKTHDVTTIGKAGLKYEFSRDSQVYLTWSTGYKGAGYDTEFGATFEDQQPVKPETSTAWELGYKTRLLDERLTLNAAIFDSDYKNLQVNANRGNPDLGIVQFATTNAGSANTRGVELELAARPFAPLTLTGGVTYLDTSVDVDGLNCPVQFQNAAPVMSGMPTNVCYRVTAGGSQIQNVRGGVLPMASKWRGSLTARYEQTIGNSSVVGFGQVSANAQSKFNFVIEQDPETVHPGYALVDLSVGVHDANNRYQVTAFVKNVLDKHYLTSIGHAATLTTAAVTPNNMVGVVPKDANRYYGVSVGVSF